MRVHIVDYGVGNLHSIVRAIEASGGEAVLTTSPADLLVAERVILPGVGAFEPCARQLRESGLSDAVVAFARSGRPFLGICVGMQLLFDESFEFGRHEGLGLIPGAVVAIPPVDDAGQRKVPNIGWRPMESTRSDRSWDGTLLEGLTPGVSSAYFVHSYSCDPRDEQDRLADIGYNGYRVCAAVHKGNITGFQCHPERSGPVGLRIMRNFLV